MTAIADFIESYRAAWEAAVAQGDVAPLTRFFHVPYFAVGGDGARTLVSSEDEIRAFNQLRLDHFRKLEARRWLLRGVDAMTVGPHATAAHVNWEGQRPDGRMALAWRHHYFIVKSGDNFKILVSTFTAGS